MKQRPWEDRKVSFKTRTEELVKALPFYTIRDLKIEKVDIYHAEMFWIGDEGLTPQHFTGLQYYKSTDTLNIYPTDEEVETAWQKVMKKHYDDNFEYHQREYLLLSEFRDDHPEVFI